MTTSTMHIKSIGQGSDMVLLHGWAMHSGYFESVVEKLSDRFRVHLVDMPGYGESRDYPQPYSIETLATEITSALEPVLQGKAIWLGWSLGGSVATWIAAYVNEKVAALILVANNPRFVQESDWPYGVEDNVLQAFANSLVSDYEKTLLRFLSLQIRGAENERELLRQLRQQMQHAIPPTAEVLKGGLEILRQFDGRVLLQQMHTPVLLIAGAKDTLVPVKAVENISAQSDMIILSTWEATGHAPFLSNPDRFTNEVKAFADDLVA